MSEPVDLVFAGEILAGFDPVEVMARVAHQLNLDEARMARLFSGERIVLRRDVEIERARRYTLQFARMGARLHMEPSTAVLPTAAPSPPVPAPAAPAPAAAGYGPYRRRRARPTAAGAPVWGLGLTGRLGRHAATAAGSIAVAGNALAAAFVAQDPVPWRLAVGAAAWAAVTLLSLRWTWLRLHDADRPGRWAVLAAVPGLGALAAMAIAALPGTRGPNAHGDEPRRWRWWRVAGAAIVVTLVAGALGWAMKTWLSPLRSQLRGQAAAVFHGHYAQSSPHKAFAMSAGGAWGWRSGLPSRGSAVYEALANCEKHRKPDRPRCEVIDIDGAPPLPSD